MHSLPQDRVGVPYVHDDCHNLYRPVNQSDAKALQVYCGGGGVGGCCARTWAEPAQGFGSVVVAVLGPHEELN